MHAEPGRTMEPMGIKEAIRYGVSKKYYLWDAKSQQQPSSPSPAADWVAGEPPREVTAAVQQLADITTHLKARLEGRPYNEELVRTYEETDAEHKRFRASRWSKLFPGVRITAPVVFCTVSPYSSIR